jgi:hypothetical protein
MIVLNTLPFFILNVLDDYILSLIDANTDDSYFISPVTCSFLKHFLIMSHRFLARRTPGGPEIDKNYFTFVVLDRSFFVSIETRHNVLNRLEHISWP